MIDVEFPASIFLISFQHVTAESLYSWLTFMQNQQNDEEKNKTILHGKFNIMDHEIKQSCLDLEHCMIANRACNMVWLSEPYSLAVRL